MQQQHWMDPLKKSSTQPLAGHLDGTSWPPSTGLFFFWGGGVLKLGIFVDLIEFTQNHQIRPIFIPSDQSIEATNICHTVNNCIKAPNNPMWLIFERMTCWLPVLWIFFLTLSNHWLPPGLCTRFINHEINIDHDHQNPSTWETIFTSLTFFPSTTTKPLRHCFFFEISRLLKAFEHLEMLRVLHQTRLF